MRQSTLDVRVLLFFALLSFSFIALSCQGSTDPEEESCSKGRTNTLVGPIGLSSTLTSYFFKTGSPVDQNCHGKFRAYVFYGDSTRFDLDAPFPPIEVVFSTSNPITDDFRTTVSAKQEEELNGSIRKYWEITADEGAKNFPDGEWYYTAYVRLLDTSRLVTVELIDINYKPRMP